MVDPSFLDLVRFGILPPDDPDVRTTLDVVDRDLKVTHAERAVLAPLLLRRVRRDRATAASGTITDPDTGTTLGRAGRC